MGVPKYKPSKSRSRLRRAHDGLVAVGVIKCQSCGLATKPHCICPNCGQYRTHKEGSSRLVIQPGAEG